MSGCSLRLLLSATISCVVFFLPGTWRGKSCHISISIGQFTPRMM